MKNKIFLLLLLVFVCACEEKGTKPIKNIDSTQAAKPDYSKFPAFNADSAYSYIQQQVNFGPRIPNTKSHKACGAFLAARFKAWGIPVIEQDFSVKAHDGVVLKGKNIIASLAPTAPRRIILAAHWDTRPWADEDPANPKATLDGANDGASGVGVILELARLFQTSSSKPTVGIDCILFDVEDYGKPAVEDSYCLGSQHWAKNKHLPNYSAYYGILLDMVGAKGARFNKESHSMNAAPSIMNRVWEVAGQSGYGEFFIHQMGGMITDDHYYVIKDANIPMIDIIEYDPHQGFGAYWHTQQDNMNVIDRRTLKAVGQTLVNVLYTEK
ncbi:MAG: M28 family peptidase [Cytophagaceae bacterium]|jgi:hypothetical protein|nr:M28 family peptidase [Cytophagaceae bacterium]